MQQQKQRSKDAVSEVDLTARNSLGEMASELGATTFTGHHDLQGEGHILALLQDGQPVESAPEGIPILAACRKQMLQTKKMTSMQKNDFNAMSRI